MKISYEITVCNEFIEIQRLLTFLLEHKRPQDEQNQYPIPGSDGTGERVK